MSDGVVVVAAGTDEFWVSSSRAGALVFPCLIDGVGLFVDVPEMCSDATLVTGADFLLPLRGQVPVRRNHRDVGFWRGRLRMF